MPRLNEMEQKYIDKLIEFANHHPEYGSAHDIWESISQADPDNQRYIHTRWLLERTLSDKPKKNILWEDIAAGANSKAYDILKRFLTIRPMLPHDQRNLYRYGNLADITAVIRPLEHVKTPGELKAEERERVDNDTVVLYEEHGYKVLAPMSQEASCYWGRGTEWCTAATKSDNAFQSYHKDGPLVICILPDGKKVQFHKDSPPMDENDSALKDITDPVLVQLCASFSRLGSISEILRDREMCLAAVKQHGKSLRHVPDALRDKEMCLEAVKQDGDSLYLVPKELRDKDLCLEAVKQNSYSLQYVPKPLCDREMCLQAVRQDGRALYYVPNELRDKKMCLEAVKNGKALRYVPNALRDGDMCLEAVKQNGWSLEYVPIKLRDKEMCLKAVKQSGWALIYVPEKLRDRGICLEAVKSNGHSLGFVPRKLRDKEVCFEAVKNNGESLRYVPNALRDGDMCLEAVKQNGKSLRYVPEELRYKEMCLEDVNKDKSSFLYFPNNLLE